MEVIRFRTKGFVGVAKEGFDWRVSMCFVKNDEHEQKMLNDFSELCNPDFPIGVFDGLAPVKNMVESYFGNLNEEQTATLASLGAAAEIDKVLTEEDVNAS